VKSTNLVVLQLKDLFNKRFREINESIQVEWLKYFVVSEKITPTQQMQWRLVGW